MIWSRAHKAMLAIGVALWLFGGSLTPGEIAAAKRREPIRPRTAIALIAYLGAALLVLAGLPRRPPQELPKK